MKKKSFLLLDEEELMEKGIVGCRLRLTHFLKSRPIEILLVILIVIYTAMVFIFFGFEDILFKTREATNGIYYFELVILGFFVAEVILYTVAYRCLYYDDCWNVFDVIVIFLSIAFVLLDLTLGDESALSDFLKIRGIFRLLRVFLLVRKLNELRKKRELALKTKIN